MRDYFLREYVTLQSHPVVRLRIMKNNVSTPVKFCLCKFCPLDFIVSSSHFSYSQVSVGIIMYILQPPPRLLVNFKYYPQNIS